MDKWHDRAMFVIVSHLDFEVICYWSITTPELTQPLCYAPSPSNHAKIESQNVTHALQGNSKGLGKQVPRKPDPVGEELTLERLTLDPNCLIEVSAHSPAIVHWLCDYRRCPWPFICSVSSPVKAGGHDIPIAQSCWRIL